MNPLVGYGLASAIEAVSTDQSSDDGVHFRRVRAACPIDQISNRWVCTNCKVEWACGTPMPGCKGDRWVYEPIEAPAAPRQSMPLVLKIAVFAAAILSAPMTFYAIHGLLK
jgi:hypothetical protein